jgi:hemerythrin-like domain-containing protein
MTAMRTGSTHPMHGAPRAAHEGDGMAVLDAGHVRILAVVRALEELAERAQGDRIDAAARASAAAIADFFCTFARRHHEDEERHVFPALLGSGDPSLVQAVLRLQTDHGWIEEDWLMLEPMVQAIATGIGHCDADVLQQGVEVFAALYRDHVALEESLAYPQARARLSAAALHGMGREMARRRRAAEREV